jgi:hypothetical protein
MRRLLIQSAGLSADFFAAAIRYGLHRIVRTPRGELCFPNLFPPPLQ